MQASLCSASSQLRFMTQMATSTQKDIPAPLTIKRNAHQNHHEISPTSHTVGVAVTKRRP